MQDKLLSAVTRYNLLKTGDRVTVALSGGADSTALLYGLLAIREKFDLTVTAAHVNHMLRGEESDRDERFVRDLCEKLGVALSVGKFDIPALRKKGESGEECARRVRYAFLAEVADGKIATAHTADDNAETVLFNLIRGAGITGACGIPVKRDNIIRPLILCSRKDIENYCEKNGISFVTDSSNLTDDYTRNRIRHKIIPEMKEINPSLCDGVSRFTETLRDADELILSLAERAIKSAKKADGYDCGELKKSHSAVLSRAVRLICERETGLLPDSVHTDLVCEIVRKNGGKCQLSGNFFAEVKNGTLCFYGDYKAEKISAMASSEFINKTVNFGPFSVKCELKEDESFNNLLANDSIDYDKIKGDVTLRPRKSGDKIRLNGRPQKSLKKLFCEMKIPADMREKIPVIADDDGVVSVLGIGCDKRVLAEEKTKRILNFSGVEIK